MKSVVQLSACLNRHSLEKRRNARVSTCEFCSHLLIIVILYLGYGLSKIVQFPSSIYTPIEVTVPPAFVASDSTQGQIRIQFSKIIPLVNQYLSGPIPVPTFDQFISLSKQLSGSGQNAFSNIISQTQLGRVYGNLLQTGVLHFAPRSKEVDSLIEYLKQTTTTFATMKHEIHESEDAGVDSILQQTGKESRALALIVIREVTRKKVNYVIRQNYTTLPNTNSLINRVSIGLDTGYQSYVISGFLTLQQTVDAWAFNYTGATNASSSNPYCRSGPPRPIFVPFPTASYNNNPFYGRVGFLLGLAMTMATMYPLARTVKTIVEEKETRMRELMKIMGLQSLIHQGSWFIVTFILFFWIAISISFISSSSFLPNSDNVIIFAFFFLFCMTEVTFAFLISVWFSNSKLAAIVAPVVLFCSILPRFIFFNTNSNEQYIEKFAASLLSPTAFTFGADIIANYEYSGVGVQYGNLFDDRFSLGTCMLMMLFDIFLYGTLAWYLDMVLPQEFGTPESPFFFLNYQYWKSCIDWSVVESVRDDDVTLSHMRAKLFNRIAELKPNDSTEGNQASSTKSVESIPKGTRASAKVLISGLRKRYSDGKLAIKNVSMAMLENQITCLLGHNGAGKSTTISILTGLLQLTRGEVNIYGNDLKNDLHRIRQITGVCPQHNVLFPFMTVTEHLMFFGRIKGLYGSRLRDDVANVTRDVGLVEKQHVLSSALSGGMKRKLSLAIALIGDPKFILLDEPTSGMDPHSRRSTWNMLEKSKKGRVILLTTHFMDEADTLADRIIILSEGRLRCSGTSLFLKSRFGAGYMLSMSLVSSKSTLPLISQGDEVENTLHYPTQKSDKDREEGLKIVSADSAANICSLVQTNISSAYLRSTIAGEMIFQLPLDSVSHFSSLFESLKVNAASLGISSFGVSITSLEQVFIRLAEEEHGLVGGVGLVNDDDEEIEGDGNRDVEELQWLAATWSKTMLFISFVNALFRRCIRRNQNDAASGIDSSYDSIYSVPATIGSSDLTMYSSPTETCDNNFGIEMESFNHPSTVHHDIDNSNDPDTLKALHHEGYHSILGGSSNQQSPSASANLLLSMRSLFARLGAIFKQRIDVILSHIIFIQLIELLGKRFHSAKRDLKGFFFQIIFPSIQILLVLSILTIRVSPAGRTMRLNTKTFNEEALFSPQVLFDNKSAHASIFNGFPKATMEAETIEIADNSTFLSEIMLNQYKKRRYGGYILNDLLPLNIAVNWQWIRSNLGYFLANGDLLATGANLLGFNIIEQLDTLNGLRIPFTATFPLVSISDFLLNNPLLGIGNTTTAGINNGTSIFNNLLPPFVTPIFQDFLRQLNATEVFPQLAEILRNATNGNTSIIVQGTLEIGSVKYLSENGTFILINSRLFIGNTSLLLPNITVNSDQILLSILPRGLQTYNLTIPTTYTVMHNSSSPHAMAIFNGNLVNAAFQMCTGGGATSNNQQSPKDDAGDPVYLVKNHPLPITALQSIEIKIILSFFASLFILVPLCYIPASFVTFIVKERSSKSKHLQFVSGVSPHLYWCATYLWDMAEFLLLTILIMFSFLVYGKESAAIFISTAEATTCVFLLFITYGASSIALSYLYSLAFENASTAQISVMAVNFITGFVGCLAYFIMINVDETRELGYTLVHLFRIFPPYNIGEGLLAVSSNYYVTYILRREVSYLEWDVAGRNIVFMTVEAIGYFGIMLIIESSFFQQRVNEFLRHRSKLVGNPPPRSIPEDEDVMNERLSIDQYDPSNTDDGGKLLVIRNLIKTYPPLLLGGHVKHAVRGVSLGVKKGERFGLLGINGAGKTTTLDVLTCVLQPTSGQLFVNGLSLSDPTNRSLFGYCPQVDPLLELMTGFETLWFFGRIRGINPVELKSRVNDLIEQVGLSKFAHRPCGRYSGGNKRKLSLAVALIGDPKLLLLDEPSTGMDPEARRKMWLVIEAVSHNRSVILVSHSMEECEALCTRVGIMVAGRLQCLGTCQHLKSKFAAGYQIEIRCKEVSSTGRQMSLSGGIEVARELSSAPKVQCAPIDFKDHILSGNLLGCLSLCQRFLTSIEILEAHDNYLRLKTETEFELAVAFDMIERNKTFLGIMDYSISQATLEQVFIQFAQQDDSPAQI